MWNSERGNAGAHCNYSLFYILVFLSSSTCEIARRYACFVLGWYAWDAFVWVKAHDAPDLWQHLFAAHLNYMLDGFKLQLGCQKCR